MRTGLLWREFAGVHVTILAATIGIVAAVCMRRRDRAQRLAMTYAFVFQGTGLVRFVLWFVRTDWMMGHYQGPPFLLFSALASLVLGIGAALLACVLSVAGRFGADARGRTTMVVRVCWVLLLVLTLVSGLLSAGALGATPRALRKVGLRHFEALESQGASAIPQLVAGLRDENRSVQGAACRLLRKLGPSAREAIPDLISYLETRTAEDTPCEAIWALGQIGPAAEPAIPVLVRLAEEERSSWWVRRAVMEALQEIGAPAGNALTRVTESAQALAARQLPAQIEALNSRAPEAVQRAADFLFSMGVYAETALPVLQSRLAKISQDPAEYDWRWSGPKGHIQTAIRGITPGIAPPARQKDGGQ